MAAIAVAAIGVGVSAYGAYSSNKRAKEAMAQADEQTNRQVAFQKEQQRKLDAQKAKYQAFQFKNPYADVKNTYAGLQTDFENVYEDLTVSTEAAEFQMEQGQQQRANIMQGLKGAAGGSGIAALAQSLAGQGTLQARQVSIDIARQEQANQQARAQGAANVQTMEAGREQLIAQGEGQAQMTRLGGEAMVQQAEMDRQATLLGIAQGGAAGANQAVQAAYSNQQAASSAAMQMQAANISAMSGSLASLGTAMPGTPNMDAWSDKTLGTNFVGSDRRLKKNINLIGESLSGLNIYSFEYKNPIYGKGLFQGVMSDEVSQEAVINNGEYDMVNYNILDVEFKQI